MIQCILVSRPRDGDPEPPGVCESSKRAPKQRHQLMKSRNLLRPQHLGQALLDTRTDPLRSMRLFECSDDTSPARPPKNSLVIVLEPHNASSSQTGYKYSLR